MKPNRSVRMFAYVAPAALLVLFFSPRSFASNSSPRSMATLTAEECMTLPGETQVALYSGRTTTLAVLRREHELRMERFRSAAALGRSLAARLKKPVAADQPPVPAKSAGIFLGANNPQGSGIQVRDSSRKGASTPMGGSSNVPGPPPPLPPRSFFDIKAVTQPQLIDMVPNPFPVTAPSVPIDYAQACAAPTTLCFYLPQGTLIIDIKMGVVYAYDYDPLIKDPGICRTNGGSLYQYGCVFSYPMSNLVDFTPKAKLSMTGPCDAPFSAVLDPRGALQVQYVYQGFFQQGQYLPTPNTLTCAVQVWMTK
jgi:hypothetical protein